MRGRKPKPNKLKLADGNPGKRKIEPEPEPMMFKPGEVPEPPEGLSATALKEWHRVAPALAESRVLSHMDTQVLAQYCAIVAEIVYLLPFTLGQPVLTAPGPVPENGRPRAERNWAQTELRNARAQLLKFAAELGLTPVSRTRLAGPGIDRPKDEFDRFRIVS